MHFQFTTLDVFTTARYIGNPLAVIRVPASLRASLMESQKQQIAREFNLSEVTFIHEPAQNEDTAHFDIFTPTARMSFAGHPTIGTAICVAINKNEYPGITKLRTVAGTIPFQYDEATGRATVSIPHDVHVHKARLPHPFPTGPGNTTNSPTVPIVSIVKGMAFSLAQLSDLVSLALMTGGLLPAQDRFKGEFLDAGSGWDIGYTGTFYYVDLGSDPEDEEVRLLRTRSIPLHEDPGTGSASAALCCFVAMQEGLEGVRRFHLIQGVEMGRRCDIFVAVTMGKGGVVQDVKLSGEAVQVMEGSLRVN